MLSGLLPVKASQACGRTDSRRASKEVGEEGAAWCGQVTEAPIRVQSGVALSSQSGAHCESRS